MTLNDWVGRVAAFSDERDWAQFHAPRNLAMALSVEANELLALYLWCADDGPQPAQEGRRERVAGEVGDVLICLLNLCHRAGIDPERALADKLAEAAKRYPADRVRGRALKYDEYPEWQSGETSASAQGTRKGP